MSFMTEFFRFAHEAGAFYGRGKLSTIPDDIRFDVEFDDKVMRSLWQECAKRERLMVPWIYPFNFLSKGHVNAIGGIDALRAPWLRFVHGPLIVDIDGGALIAKGPLSKWSLHPEPSPSYCIDRTVDDFSVWFLSLFAARNMLAVQNTDWLAKEHDRIEAFQRRQRERSPETPRPSRSLSSWLSQLSKKPPRCIRDVAVPARNGRGKQAPGHPGAGTTLFEIRVRGEDKPLTVYGRPLADDTGLGSPIMVGSLKLERAVFMFEALLDGWDGENSGNAESPFPLDRPRLVQFKCPRCDGRHFHLRAAFEYPDDLDELNDQERARTEDFFTWFWILGRCSGCQWEGTIADIECA